MVEAHYAASESEVSGLGGSAFKTDTRYVSIASGAKRAALGFGLSALCILFLARCGILNKTGAATPKMFFSRAFP